MRARQKRRDIGGELEGEGDVPLADDASAHDFDERSGLDHGPLADRLGYVLRRAQIAIFEDFIAACGEHDIRPGQYSVLTLIECNPGSSQTQIAEAVGIKKPNFVALIDGLEKRSLVRRMATPGDRRSYALYLTNDGKALMRKLHRTAADHEQRIIARVGADMHRRMFAPLQAIAQLGSVPSSSKVRVLTHGPARRR